MKKILFICIFIIYVSVFSLKVNAISDVSISAESYVLIEANSGEIIAANNELQQRPMASTTKIMTTLLLIESGNLEEARDKFEKILPLAWYEDQSLEFYVACEKFLLKELGVIKSDTVRKPGVQLTDFEKEELLNLYKRLK